MLDDRFRKYGKLVEKGFFNIKPTNIEGDKKLLKVLMTFFNEGSKELRFTLVKTFKDGWILDPIDPETDNMDNLIDVLVSEKMAVRIDDDELTQLLEKKVEIEKENLKKIENALKNVKEKKVKEKEKSVEKIVVAEERKKEIAKPLAAAEKKPKRPDGIIAKLTALTSPNDFYLTRIDTLQQFNQLHTDIQILAPAMQPLIDFECGTYCLAQEPYDSLWYRAKIIDSDESIITVLCMDNGKTFSIENKICLKALPDQLQQKAFFGIPCSLAVKIERKFDDEATEIMLKMVEKEIEYTVTLNTTQMNFIELFHDNMNVADLLVEKKFAKRYDIFPSGNGYTSHVNSSSDFFVQLEVDQLKLDLISAIMDRTNGKFEKVVNPQIGHVIAAKFPDDDCWYRSKIESIDNDGFMVSFIDYGNSCFVTEIGAIEESITALSAMSKKCTLAKPKHITTSFSDAAEKIFLDITANGATVLEIRVVKPGEVAEVELFCEGQNIIDLMTK